VTTAIDHVSAITLFVEDLAAARTFYTGVFRAPVIFEDATSVAMRFGDLVVNLLHVDSAKEIVEPGSAGGSAAGSRFQLSIWVPDVDAVCGELQRRAVTLLAGPTDRPWGMRTANFVDPAGHSWEVAQRVDPGSADSGSNAMRDTRQPWEDRMAALWASIDGLEPEAFVREVETLAGELPAGSAVALFERASAQDSTGRPDLAVPLYRAALAVGLTGARRRRAVIQTASSLRNLGDAAEAAALLSAELHRASDELDGAVRAFLALALVDLAREREAVGVSLAALAAYLPRYNRSLARYAGELMAGNEDASQG
jgi:catechol 2,3-dioxygenase-like lactoylglutathione lyase family enzyme